MGRTARFEQIYVANLDAEPIEQETLTGVKSILTKEVEANELLLVDDLGTKGRLGIANTVPTKSLSVGDKFFIDETDEIVLDLKGRGKVERFFVENQLAIGTTNPTRAFQINSGETTKVAIDLEGRDLMTVNGNLVATNVIISDRLTTSGSNLAIKETSSNVITVIGGITSSNLSVGSNVGIFDQGSNVMMLKGNVYQEGYYNLIGNIVVTGNISVTETATYIATQDLRVANVVIHSGFGNDILSRETAFVMTPGAGYSNVALGFVGGDRGREMAFFHTDAFGGYNVATINVDDTKTVNVHVYGDIYTSNNIGAANTFPTHDLCVGSNVFIDDTNSNVVYANGNVYAKGLILGSTGLRAGNLLVLDATAATPVTISGNVQMSALRTTGTAPSGISNLNPTDTLSVGAKIFANTTAINTLRILGNTATTNLVTDMVFSSSNLVVHADRFGGSNVLVLKSGPTASNVSSIEVYGANTSSTNQMIRFKTKNTERIRITSDGKVGIANSSPTERLTVSGNVYVIGSNAVATGNIWGSTGNIAMRTYTSVISGENRVENIVGTGKGLNFYASTTPTMGVPKLTILESSNVGIGVAAPEGILHTSGGTVFINDQVVNRNSFNHLGTPLVVTNSDVIDTTDDDSAVMHLCREGPLDSYGARATFKLGKHNIESGASRTRLDIYLADDDYSDEIDILTLRSDGRVGIGSTQPEAYLEVISAGIGNARQNSLMVHNHALSPGTAGDAIIAAQTDELIGNAFTSYIQSEDDFNPRGWSVGVTGLRDFRITRNINKVNASADVGLFIDGTTRDVGIGTDAPRGALEVNGNVVIGQQLTFGGVTGDEFGNTHIIERRYTAGQSRNELLLFKGNDASSVDTGPDRIRHIAGEHVFQTYTSSGETLYGLNQILSDMDGQTDKPLVVCDNQIVVVGGTRSDADNRGPNTKLVVNGDIEFGGGGAFRLTGFQFSTDDGGFNIIRSLLDGSARRPLTFVHEVDAENDAEFARFDGDGRLGMGTVAPSSNIHVYDTTPGNVDLLRLESSGTDKETGILLYTNDGEGGYVRAFSNTVNNTTGLVMGVANNSTQTNCIHLIHSSNVGIGTHSPATKFHIYDGNALVENSSSNAVIELKTSEGSGHFYLDTTGNVFINPTTTSKTAFIKGSLDVSGDLAVDGIIDFSIIGVNLGGLAPQADIHTGGGIITNSQQVSRKTYAQTFSVGEGTAKDIQLMFGNGAFYAKVTAILRRTDGSTVEDLSTMILELQGGTGNATLSTLDIAIGTKNLFGGTNSYPWSPTVTTGIRGISITPYNTVSARIYSYDIFVELTSACGGKLEKITRDLTNVANLDNGTGGQTQIVAFTY